MGPLELPGSKGTSGIPPMACMFCCTVPGPPLGTGLTAVWNACCRTSERSCSVSRGRRKFRFSVSSPWPCA
eukprot:1850915-Alexandrium_andersonii.AAC.1